jgi:CBS domain-containing protein
MATTPKKSSARRGARSRGPRPAAKPEPTMKLVNAVMIRDPVTIDTEATLLAAAELMRDANVGMLPVMADDQLRGVITDRDLVIRAMARDARPSEVRVGDCLSEPVQCAEPDWTVEEAMEEMARQQVGRLPVVDPRGNVVGVVTLSSLALRSSKPAETLDTAQEVSRRSARAA